MADLVSLDDHLSFRVGDWLVLVQRSAQFIHFPCGGVAHV